MKEMNDQTALLLEKLASKLGTTVEFLWTILLKQATLIGITNICEFILVLIVGFIFYKVCKYIDKIENSIFDTDLVIVLETIVGSIWIVFFILTVVGLNTAITALINPEYWALNEILKYCN